MKLLTLCTALFLIPTTSWAEFSCPQATEPACLDHGDKVCPGSTICVDKRATCFDNYPCDPGDGFVCQSNFDKVLQDAKVAAYQHGQLASENTVLREKRLERKNCVLNASTLAGARQCVRQP